MRSNGELIDHLTRTQVLRSTDLIAAFGRVDRADFVPEELKSLAYLDGPLPIGHGATISQPTVVAFMLELLSPAPTHAILDVGAGSGYTTALLCQVAANVYAVELEPALIRAANGALEKYADIEIAQASGGFGLPQFGPYDRILVSASAAELPQELVDQLAPGGIMVIPVGSEIWKVAKNDGLAIARYPGYAFVRLRPTTS